MKDTVETVKADLAAGGYRPPTAKQLKFARAIARALAIEMPAERTRQSLFLFIREHRPEFDRMQREDAELKYRYKVYSAQARRRARERSEHPQGCRFDWTDTIDDPQEDQDMFWAMGGDPMTGCLGDD